MKRFLASILLIFGFTQPTVSQEIIPDIVETISIKGVIDESMAYFMSREVDEINSNKKVKAVILSVNSPGGSVVATSILHSELARMRVPIVAWCEYVCASGAMYILMNPQVKYIAIRPDTITGSIGVIAQVHRYHRLLEWAKINYEVYRSGRLKDFGNAARKSELFETKYLQSIVDHLAQKFYNVVGKHRNIRDWREVKDARIFFGEEGVKIGLVDSVMSKKEVILKAKELSGSDHIYTRAEMERLSDFANNSPRYYKNNPPSLLWFKDVVEEIRNGETVKFEYRLQMEF